MSLWAELGRSSHMMGYWQFVCWCNGVAAAGCLQNMLFLKGITAKLFKRAIFIDTDMHAIPKVPIRVALTEIWNRICALNVAFHWIFYHEFH